MKVVEIVWNFLIFARLYFFFIFFTVSVLKMIECMRASHASIWLCGAGPADVAADVAFLLFLLLLLLFVLFVLFLIFIVVIVVFLFVLHTLTAQRTSRQPH